MRNEKASPKGDAVVIGVGAETGLGAALARRFAREGLRVTIAGRTPERLRVVAEQITAAGGAVSVKVADAANEAGVAALFDEADSDGAVELVAYNVGSNVAASALETTPELFERLWRQNTFGGFIVGREAARRMAPRGKGTILFTGATASMRARPPFLAFGAAKAGLRAVAQGLAREFSPQGVHVAHVVIDGVIEGDYAATNFAEYVRSKGADGLLAVDDIADVYWTLHRQPRSVWTHELDLRPFKEPF
ncbi:SDR family NAD(P)-dependent oxidoreductase [Methylocystis echinoides]|uniref:Glucose 1-dehydrogenase n=1 Tax=Methylocystis echinoides TaxID=29468 RepID=A0A9W6GZV5_9HYPH|nr:SDR family NAD(P)-dependent oxidoreductase [Methylocystis echinoides]GLI96044.1 glucose 1-dehydrogenase [Methylocystis echinoides]